MQMNVTTETFEVTRVTLVGRLDVQGVEAIGEQFKASTCGHGRPVIVDLSEVTFITSLGMRMLLHTQKALKQEGQKMILLKPQPLVEDALKKTYLDAVFPIVHNEREAYSIILGFLRAK